MSLISPLAVQRALTPAAHNQRRTVLVHSRRISTRCSACNRTGTRETGPAPVLLAGFVAAQAFFLPGPVLAAELPTQALEATGIEASSQLQGEIRSEGLPPPELMLVAAETPLSAEPGAQQESSSPAPLTDAALKTAPPPVAGEQQLTVSKQTSGAEAWDATQPSSAVEEFQVADTASVEGMDATAEESVEGGAAAAAPPSPAAEEVLVAEAPALPLAADEPARESGRSAESLAPAAEEFAVAEAPEEPASETASPSEPSAPAAEEFVVAEAESAPTPAIEPVSRAAPAAAEPPSLLADDGVPGAGEKPVANAPPPAVPVSTDAAKTSAEDAGEPSTPGPKPAAAPADAVVEVSAEEPADSSSSSSVSEAVEVSAEPAGSSSGSGVKEAALEQERELVAEIEKELPQVEEQLAALEAAATAEPTQQLAALEKELQVIEEETLELEEEEVRSPGAVGLVAEAKGILSQLATLKTLLRDLSDSFLFGN